MAFVRCEKIPKCAFSKVKFSSKLLFWQEFEFIFWHVVKTLFQSSTRCEKLPQNLTRSEILFQKLSCCKKYDPKYDICQKNVPKNAFFPKYIFFRVMVFKTVRKCQLWRFCGVKLPRKLIFLKTIFPWNFGLLNTTFLRNPMLCKRFDSISDEWWKFWFKHDTL